MKRIMKRIMKRMAFLLVITLVMSMALTTLVSFAEDGIKFKYRDDFNSFDTKFWAVKDKHGNPISNKVNLSDGILTLSNNETDNPGYLISKGIPIEKGDTLIVKRRTYAHTNNDKFAPSMFITEEIDDTWNFKVDRPYNFLIFFQHLYFTYDKGRYPENLTKGNFGYARLDGFKHPRELAKENYGITRSTLDEWVEEEFIYDTASGQVTITSGGETMSFQSRPLEHDYVRFAMSPYGWFTGQYDKMDWIEFTVTGPDAELLIEDNSNPIDSQTPAIEGPVPTNQIRMTGTVKDAISKLPANGVTVSLFEGRDFISKVMVDGSGQYSFTVDPGKYNITYDKSGYIQEKYYNITGSTGTTTYLQTVFHVPEGTSQGEISGVILNAITGHIETGVTIVARKGINNTNSSTKSTLDATSKKGYEFVGAPGNYTLIAMKHGFIEKSFPITITSGQNRYTDAVAISPTLSADQMRVVLRWSKQPRDLDLHLYMIDPATNKQEAIIGWMDKSFSNSETSIELDVDNREGEGPETITVTNILPKRYVIFVHNASSPSSTGTKPLSDSQAVLDVYIGNTLVKTYNVPNKSGDLWKVLEYNGQIFTDYNNIEDTNNYD